MALLKIYEPGQTPQPPHPEEIAVGIDLGTTNSLIAISVNQKPQILLDDNGHFMQPSIVAVIGDNEFKAGRAAQNFVGEKIYSIKPMLTSYV